jgi:hypothetical protein
MIATLFIAYIANLLILPSNLLSLQRLLPVLKQTPEKGQGPA